MLLLVRLESLIWNFSQFHAQSSSEILRAFLIGLRFDVTANGWLMIPLLVWSLPPWPESLRIWWTRGFFTIAFVVFVPFLTLNLIDVEFVNFVGRRLSAEVLFLLGEADGKAQGFLATYFWLFAVATGTLIIQGLGTYWISFSPRAPVLREKAPVKVNAALTLALLVLWVIAARGGLQNKPISFVDARKFDSTTLNNLVLNTSFNILKNMSKEKLARVHYFKTREEMLPLLNGSQPGPSVFKDKKPKANVVILIMESFGLEYTGLAPGNPSWTPFLDGLAKEGVSFELGIANGRRSIEGVAAVLSGIPALMNEPFISSPFTANKFLGLGTLLGIHGYDTAFFHGGKNGTMHFDAFARSAGINKYFGASEYPDQKDHDGVWGIYDKPFMSWTEEQIGQLRPPFMAAFFSISSHQPYLIPPADQKNYPEGPIPILKTVKYADDALKLFFEKARKEPWFDNTIFVITADHTFMPVNDSWNHELGRWRIPFVLYAPKVKWPKIETHEPVQQIDVLPTVMDMLGYNMPEMILLGRSVFVPGERTAVTFSDGEYLLISKDHLLRQQPASAPQMYALNDPFMKKSLEGEPKKHLEDRLHAVMQYFSEGMWDNRLYAPAPR